MAVYPKIAQLKSPERFQEHLESLGVQLPMDAEILTADDHSPMAQSLQVGPHLIGNRWVIHPMEGWDANRDGSPSEHTLRRWRHFGLSGAKMVWGGEAAAVQPDGRANPHQTLAIAENKVGLAALLHELQSAHESLGETTDDLLVGLQLTHSGRFSRPNSKRLEPRIAYHHPLLDAKFGIAPDDDSIVWSDDEIERLIDRYVDAARLAWDVGFQFVDVKACHGYLLHEFLSARRRAGRFGGDLAGRSRVLRTIIERIRSELPDLSVVVRLSIFDTLPYEAGDTVGRPSAWTESTYDCGFGLNSEDPTQLDLKEPFELLRQLKAWGVIAANISGGSPYYNPHVQRPAIFPPSDGYPPPEDPLYGVARQIHAARACKQAVPDLVMVGTGYSYLQDYLPHVAQAVVRDGWIDLVGLGRVVLSYPELPRETLATGSMARKKICRTFSDCTTAPRNGIISGCYPLDPYYKALPEAALLRGVKSSDDATS